MDVMRENLDDSARYCDLIKTGKKGNGRIASTGAYVGSQIYRDKKRSASGGEWWFVLGN